MLYVAVVNGVEHQVEISAQTDDIFTIYIDGEHVEVSARQIGPATLSIIAHDHHAYVADLELDPVTQDVQKVCVDDTSIDVAVYSLRHQALRQAQQSIAAEDGPVPITTPMPGKVVAVLVRNGDFVEAGQGLVVVEAMKMENELRAPKAGQVQHLDVVVGAAVNGGAKLCTVE